ncbi:recombinase family protein [Bacillus altitudinis]|uniref:recombinase family protein n=1 Tax=Bacillus altitudinis TaxID=293387 RepID=UPI002100F0BB|nr:recombinase family protein [Bacillus altitudinis]UTV34842.1 recombinase family protein [Bacillus altitudinis]
MTVYGYARVSTIHQDLALQIESLLNAGVSEENVFADKKTGKNMNREALQELLSKVEKGDTIIVKKLDRLGRSVSQITTLVEELYQKGIYIKSIEDGVDTSNDNVMSKAMIYLLAIFAEMERTFIIERTQPALEDAKRRGVTFGRPYANKSVYDMAVQDYLGGNMTSKEIIKKYGTDKDGKDLITEATLFRRVREYQAYHKAIESFKASGGTKTIQQLIAEGEHRGQKNPQPILKEKKLTKMLQEEGLI